MEDQQEDTRCQVEENLSKREQWHHGLGIMPQVNMDTKNIFSHSFIHNLSSLFSFCWMIPTIFLKPYF